MSKFSTPFFKKSPLQGAYENAADGEAFMGGLVSGQEQFAKLQDDITSATTSYYDAITKKCPKGKVRSKINNKCVSKKGSGKEYDV